ncbi:2-oxo acid dehydrogenase subunit E2 [Candidatus Woesearchaeota archaeon]|nr:2-oxo acid dehydrogenase subunit E2 [Candidatus Woesearchaeota archaeon]
MAFEFKFPDVGEGIHEGEVVSWKVKEGDRIKADQVLAEVQTDKAIVEIPAPRSGILLQRNVLEGQVIKVGDVFCVIGDEGEKVAQPTPKVVVAASVVERPAPKPEAQKVVAKETISEQMRPVMAPGKVIATPRTRQLARSLGIDIASVTGSGQMGRITEEDIQRAAKGSALPPEQKGAPVTAPAPAMEQGTKQPEAKHIAKVTFEKYGSVLRIPLRGIRKATADHMVRSWTTIPHVTHMDEADVTDLSLRREKEKGVAERKGVKLTYLPFIAKAVIAALHMHPYFNSSIDEESGDIVAKKYYNIGVAVDTSSGLMAPSVKNADKMSILELASEMQKLAEKCRDKSISVDELQGGTFTITNIGSFGGMMATPIINHPEVAILGVGAIREKPIVKEGKIVVRKMMPLFLSFDHRVVDGAAAAKFMNDIIRHLEDPDLMLVDVV